MARTSPRERPDHETILWPIRKECPACGFPMRVRYENRRTVVSLSGTQRLCLKIPLPVAYMRERLYLIIQAMMDAQQQSEGN